MIFLWELKPIIVGLLFGIGLGIGLFLIAEKLAMDMREDDPDNEFINSDGFIYLMNYIMPVTIVIGSAILIGPLFGWGYNYILNYEDILGLNPRIFYVLVLLAFSIILDIAVFISKTPFPLFKLAANSWMFLTLGLLLHLLMYYS